MVATPAECALQDRGWHPADQAWAPTGDAGGTPWPVWEAWNTNGHYKALFGPAWVTFYRLVRPGRIEITATVRRDDVPAVERAGAFNWKGA